MAQLQTSWILISEDGIWQCIFTQTPGNFFKGPGMFETIKKAEPWRIDSFELWHWRTLERPLDSKEIKSVHPKGNQSWIFTEELMLKLNLQYFGHLMQRSDSWENIVLLGKIEGRRRRGQQRMRWLDGVMIQWTWTWANSGRWWGTGRPGVL